MLKLRIFIFMWMKITNIGKQMSGNQLNTTMALRNGTVKNHVSEDSNSITRSKHLLNLLFAYLEYLTESSFTNQLE